MSFFFLFPTIKSGKSNGRLIICGGVDKDNTGTSSNKCFEYLKDTDEWNHFTSMNEPRVGASFVQLDAERFMIIGRTF